MISAKIMEAFRAAVQSPVSLNFAGELAQYFEFVEKVDDDPDDGVADDDDGQQFFLDVSGLVSGQRVV